MLYLSQHEQRVDKHEVQRSVRLLYTRATQKNHAFHDIVMQEITLSILFELAAAACSAK